MSFGFHSYNFDTIKHKVLGSLIVFDLGQSILELVSD